MRLNGDSNDDKETLVWRRAHLREHPLPLPRFHRRLPSRGASHPSPTVSMKSNPRPKIPVFDGHNDILLHLHFLEPGDPWSFFARNDRAHIDLPRAFDGGFAGGFFAVLAPNTRGDKLGRAGIERTAAGYSIPMAPEVPFEEARDFAHRAIGILHDLERGSGGKFVVARDVATIEDALRGERVAAVLHFEGAEPIDEDLNLLQSYYDAGLRSVGIVWSRPNKFGHGVPFRYPCTPDVGPGLTDAGKRLVKACNEMGILLDLAHLNEEGFWDVVDHSDRPIVVSHACVHAICPSARNLTDDQIDAIGASGGVIGVNFFVGDVRADGTFEVDTPLEDLVRHFDYIVDRIGIDHVAFGSDFDGARVPRAIGDVAGLPRLVDALRRGGYDEESLEKIAHGNWVRVLRGSV
jgi:membrane dipeptidase